MFILLGLSINLWPQCLFKITVVIYRSSCNHIIPVLPFVSLPTPTFHPQLARLDNISAVICESLEIGIMAGCVLMLVYLTRGYFWNGNKKVASFHSFFVNRLLAQAAIASLKRNVLHQLIHFMFGHRTLLQTSEKEHGNDCYKWRLSWCKYNPIFKKFLNNIVIL